MKMQVNIQQTDGGIKYFHIYEVRATRKDNGATTIIDRYLSQKEAQEELEFAEKAYKDLYSAFWMRAQMVWC